MNSAHTTTVRGAKIRYWTYHEPTKPTVVFVHGFTGSHEGFQYIIPHLKNFHIIVPDLPGFGESELGSSDWGIDEIAARVNEFIVSLKLKQPPYLLSHSMGGLVAASMLSQAPKLYDTKTVFVSPAVERIPWADMRKIGAWANSLMFFLGKTVPVVGPKLVKSKLLSRISTKLIMISNDTTRKKEIYQHHFKNLEYISSIDFYYRLHSEIVKSGAADYSDALKQFDILLIAGKKDNVMPLAGQRRFQESVGAKLHIIPGVGHLAHYETPTAIAEATREFLTS